MTSPLIAEALEAREAVLDGHIVIPTKVPALVDVDRRLAAALAAAEDRATRLERERDGARTLARDWHAWAPKAMDAAREAEAEVARLQSRCEELERQLDEAQLRSIEARNPGIDMDEVRRLRALAAPPVDLPDSPACATCQDKGWVAVQYGQDWEQEQCPDCPPDLPHSQGGPDGDA